jgi:hypothetical protein
MRGVPGEEHAADPELVRDPVVQTVPDILLKGVARGQVRAEAAVPILARTGPALMFQHLVLYGTPPPRSHIEDIIDRVILPAAKPRHHPTPGARAGDHKDHDGQRLPLSTPWRTPTPTTGTRRPTGQRRQSFCLAATAFAPSGARLPRPGLGAAVGEPDDRLVSGGHDLVDRQVHAGKRAGGAGGHVRLEGG